MPLPSWRVGEASEQGCEILGKEMGEEMGGCEIWEAEASVA